MGALTTRIAVAQLELAPGSLDENRDRTVDAIRDATEAGAGLIVLPELASSGYGLKDWSSAQNAAEPIPGPATEAWQAEAQRADCYVAGGICERKGEALYNSVALVGPNGVLGVYRKLHLFDHERLLFAPGDLGLPVFTLPFGRVGLLVCYDLRFVEAMRILSLQGADLIAVPTAWTSGFDSDPPADGVIDQVRAAAVQANLCQTFVAAASRVGADDDVRFLGSSVIVNPYGRFVYGPADSTSEVVRTQELDLADARHAKVRGRLITPMAERRVDVYGPLLGYEHRTGTSA